VKKKPTAHSQNILHVDVLYNIKRKKYKTVCAELAFAKSPSTEWFNAAFLAEKQQIPISYSFV
jgi:hypothetical protein